ncbi:hypothetical protein AB1N83_001836 [Pleurotus pulmonarius]
MQTEVHIASPTSTATQDGLSAVLHGGSPRKQYGDKNTSSIGIFVVVKRLDGLEAFITLAASRAMFLKSILM